MNVVSIKEKKDVNYKSCFDVIGPVMIGPRVHILQVL